MNLILVPTDFSTAAKNALDYAVNIAKNTKADILLLNAYAMPRSGSAVMIDVSDVLKQDAQKKLAEEAKRVTAFAEGVNISYEAYNGTTVSTIQKICKDKAIDLIIMGTTGASGLKEAFIGSNTSDLIKEVDIPIIAVPVNFEGKSFQKITLSTDLSHLKSSQTFDPLREIMQTDNESNIQIINVADNSANIDPVSHVDDAIDLDKMFFGLKHNFKFIENADVEMGILNHITSEKADLLVVVSRKRNFFERLFKKSISKKLTMHSPIPIMVLSEAS